MIAQAILKLRNTWTSVPVVHQGTVHDHADWGWWSCVKNNEVFLDSSTFALAIDNLTVNSGWTFPTDFDEVLDE